MINIVRALHDLIHTKHKLKIKLCHWKSNKDIDLALKGDTDLDILVDDKDVTSLLEVFNKLDIREVRSWYHQQYPGIRDFVGFDEESFKIIHFHLHTKTILGKSGLKEIHLPIEKTILDNIIYKSDFPIVCPEVELIVFLIRHSAKETSGLRIKNLIKRFIGRSISTDNKEEFHYLIDQIDMNQFTKVLAEAPLENSIKSILIEIVKKKTYPDRHTLRKVYIGLDRYQRFSTLERHFVVFSKKIFSKYISIKELNGKETINGGTLFALVGMDGSGKSTLADRLVKKLSYKLRVNKVYMGSSDRSIVKSIFFFTALPFLALSKVLKSHNLRFLGWYIVEYGYYHHRKMKYAKALKKSRRGSIIIFERFPIRDVSDYPFLTYDHKGKPLTENQISMKRRLEKIYEQTFPLPDKQIFLNVPLELALQRKPDHDRNMLQNKHKRFDRYSDSLTSKEKVLKLNSSDDIESLERKAMKYIWDNI